MPQYPLPALDVRTQQSDPLEQVGKVLSLQNMMRQSRFQPQLQAEQLKGAQLENTGREQENTVRARQMQDQQNAMAILGKNKGDLDASLPELSQSVSPQTFLGLRKMGLEINKTIAETEKDKLPVIEDQNNRLQGLLQQVQALPPDQYAQQWPQIAAAAKAIKPDLKVDLSQPIPQENLGLLGLQFMTLSAAIEKKKAADQAEASAAALPGIKAESDIKVGQANAMKGGAAVGTGLDVQEANAWLKKNPGKDLADYAKYKATLVPAYNFNLQNAGATGTPNQPSAIAKAIADGSMKWTDAVSARTPMAVKQALLSEVKGINPQFNSGDFSVEQKVKTAFTSGDYSKKLNSIATAREHMKVFTELGEKLDNGDVQALNRLSNAVGVQFGSDKVTNFNIAKQFFAGEVGQAVVAGQGTGAERGQLADDINNASSWKQLSGALATADKLLEGKQTALKQTYEQGVKATPNFGGSEQSQGWGSQFGGSPHK